MMRYIFFGLIIIAFAANSQDKQLDSLQNELQKARSIESEIDILARLSQTYTRLSLPRAEQYANDALAKASSVNYQAGIASAYNCLGICNSIQGQYTKGLEYFIRALRIREDQNDFHAAARTMNNMTRIFLYQKDYDKAIEYSNKSLAILEKTNNLLAIGNANVILGSIYKDKKDWPQALDAFNVALDIFKKSSNKPQQGWALIKIADVFEATKNYKEALQSCSQAMALIDVKADLFTAIELYQSMGLIHAGMKDQKNALLFLHKAMKLADDNNDSNGRISTRLKLSETYKRFKQYDSSLYYHEDYTKVNTETFNAEKANHLAMLEKVYQTEKKDQTIKLNEQKIEQQKAIIIIVSVLLMAIAVLSIILFRYSREKRRINKALVLLNKDISEKNEEIQAQSEELSEANEEISKINENLEMEVDLRTDKIKAQNQKLIEYAYFNAHNVRGPLARILGLAMLIEMEKSPEAIKSQGELMHQCAIELDTVIREISEKLEKE